MEVERLLHIQLKVVTIASVDQILLEDHYMVIATPTFFENGGWCSMSRNNCPWTVVYSNDTNKNSSKNSKMAEYDSTLTQLWLKSFGIRLEDKSRIGTPIRRSLVEISKFANL